METTWLNLNVTTSKMFFLFLMAFWRLGSKESTCYCGRCKFGPWVGRIPWRRKWQPTPEFLPGEFHGQRSLAGYSPWSHTESDMTEGQTLSLFSISGSVGSIPGRGTKILLATRHGQKKKKNP